MNLIVNRRKDDRLQLRGGKRDARMEHKNPFIECDTPHREYTHATLMANICIRYNGFEPMS